MSGNITKQFSRTSRDDENNLPGSYDLSFKMALPMVAVGTFLLALSFAFCCYLVKKKSQRSKACGYKKVTVKRNNKSSTLDALKNDTCVVCLEEFKVKNVLAVCPCGHVFHQKCLVKWLKLRKTCPMCMATISVSYRQSYAVGHSSVSISLNQPPDADL